MWRLDAHHDASLPASATVSRLQQLPPPLVLVEELVTVCGAGAASCAWAVLTGGGGARRNPPQRTARAAVPIESGENTYSVQVNVTFELK